MARAGVGGLWRGPSGVGGRRCFFDAAGGGVEFACQSEAAVVLGEGLGLVPVRNTRNSEWSWLLAHEIRCVGVAMKKRRRVVWITNVPIRSNDGIRHNLLF